jgi:hypothetical protein
MSEPTAIMRTVRLRLALSLFAVGLGAVSWVVVALLARQVLG